MAEPFDPIGLKVLGDPFPVAENVGASNTTNAAAFSASSSGIVSYRTGTNTVSAQLTWLSRSGQTQGLIGEPKDYRGVDLSPDGRRVVTHLHVDPGGDIWMIDTERGVNSRFTFDAARHYAEPLWSPDGRYVAYASQGVRLGVNRRLADGATQDEFLTELDGVNTGPTSWSSDGKYILYSRVDGKKIGRAHV